MTDIRLQLSTLFFFSIRSISDCQKLHHMLSCTLLPLYVVNMFLCQIRGTLKLFYFFGQCFGVSLTWCILGVWVCMVDSSDSGGGITTHLSTFHVLPPSPCLYFSVMTYSTVYISSLIPQHTILLDFTLHFMLTLVPNVISTETLLWQGLRT